MKRIAKFFLYLVIAMLSCNAQAQIFMCKDAAGKTFTSDRAIPECADRPVRELGTNGMVRREIPRPMTAEEKKQKKLEEEKHIAEIAAAEEKKRSDSALLTRYSTEKEIEATRERTLDIEKDKIKREHTSIAAAEERLKKAKSDIQAFSKTSTSNPTELTRQLEESQQSIKDSKIAIQDAEAEIVQINAKYDETVKRFREITGVESK